MNQRRKGNSCMDRLNAILIFFCLTLSAATAEESPHLELPLGHPTGIYTASLSKDGQLLVTGGERSAVVWRVSDRAQIRQVTTNSSVTNAVVLNDGSIYIAADYGHVGKWTMNAGVPVLFGDGYSLVDFAFADSMGLLTLSIKGLILRWNISDASAAPHHIDIGCTEVLSIALSQDGQYLAATCRIGPPPTVSDILSHRASELAVLLWSVRDNRLVWSDTLKGSSWTAARVGSARVRFSTSERYVVMGDDNSPVAVEIPDRSRVQAVRSLIEATDPTFKTLRTSTLALAQTDEDVICSNVSRIWSRASGTEVPIRRKAETGAATSSSPVAFSPGLDLFLHVNSAQKSVDVYNVKERTWAAPFQGTILPIKGLAVSPNGNALVINSGASLRIWDLTSGREQYRFLDGTFFGEFTFSADSRLLTARGLSTTAGVIGLARIDPVTGTSTTLPIAAPYTFFSLSQDGDIFAASGRDNTVSIHDTHTGQIRHTLKDSPVLMNTLTMSPDGKWVFASGLNENLNDPARTIGTLWNVADESAVPLTFKRLYREWIFSPNGAFLVGRSADGTITRWNTDNTRVTVEAKLTDHPSLSEVSALSFSPDSNHLIVGYDNVAFLLAADSLGVVDKYPQPTQVTGVAILPSMIVVTAGMDGTVRFWRKGPQPLCTIASLDDALQWDTAFGSPFAAPAPRGNVLTGHSRWIAFDRNGHFDTANFDDTKDVHWVLPSDPLNPLPLETLLTVAYEPTLLARTLRGETIPGPQVFQRNFLRPIVKIKDVAARGDSVVVRVEVTPTSAQVPVDGRLTSLSSGFKDLRVLRSGRMVAEYSGRTQGAATAISSPSRCDATHSNPIVVTCRGIQLPPRTTSLNQTTGPVKGSGGFLFTAYAFSDDGIKSDTDVFKLDNSGTRPRQASRTAYVIAVGVNANTNCKLDLTYAAKDAHETATVFKSALQNTHQFKKVIAVELLSDYTGTCNNLNRREGKNSRITKNDATRENIQTILAILAGDISPRGGCSTSASPCFSELRRVGPDDLVIMSVSSHGYRDRGKFYLIPSNTDPVDDVIDNSGNIAREITKRGISSDDLAAWIRNIDANMAFIFDSCYSEGAINSNGFKAGPLGSRDLGEIAYTKGMIVLAGSQTSGFARETSQLGHGLLTYALLKDGIESNQVATVDSSTRVTISALFDYASRDVPALYKRYFSGSEVQVPKIFNFAQKANDPIVFVKDVAPEKNVKSFQDLKLGMSQAGTLDALIKCCAVERNAREGDLWSVKDGTGKQVGQIAFRKNKLCTIQSSQTYTSMPASDLVSSLISEASGHCSRGPGIPGLSTFKIDNARADRFIDRRATSTKAEGTITLGCGLFSVSVQVFGDGSIEVETAQKAER